MKNKNLLKALAALTLGSAAAFGLTMAGCSGPEEENPGDTHEHSYSTEWTSDETGHWHVATCDDLHEGDEGYTKDFAEHVDEGNDGICDICHYVISEPEGEHYVEFELNGHGTEIAPVLVVEGETVSRPADPTADGYTFGGWYTDNHTFEVAYDFNAPVTGTVILYAKWTQNEVTPPAEETYTVTFQLNGHGTAIAAKEVAANGKVTAPTAPTADGWTFGGWYSDSALTNEYDFDTPVTADVTLYAKWTENTVTPPDEGDEGNVIILDTAKNFTYDGEEDVVLEFTAPTAGNYTVTVTENSYISVYTQEAWDDWGDPFVDGNETNTGVIKLTEGEKVNLVLQCADPGNYTITITEGGEIVDNSIDPIEVGVNSNIDVLAGENGVQTTIEFETEGTYTVTVTPTGSATLPDDIYVMLSGSRMPIILNSENNYTREIVIQSADVYEIMIAHDEADTVSLWILIDEKAESEDPEPEEPTIEDVTVSAENKSTLADGDTVCEGITAVGAFAESSNGRTLTYAGEELTIANRWQLSKNIADLGFKVQLDHDATILVYASGSNATSASTLALYNSERELVENTTQDIGLGGSSDIGVAVFEVKANTVYYIGRATSSTTNVYYIAVLYNGLNEKTVDTVDRVDATCEEVGNLAYTVTDYGRYILADGTAKSFYQLTIPATGHDYTGQEVKVTETPTEEAGGTATVVCKTCDDVLTINLPALTSEDYTRGDVVDGQCEYTYTDPTSKVVVKFKAAHAEEVVVENYAGTYTYTVSSSNPVSTTADGSNWDASKIATFGTSYNGSDFKFAGDSEKITLTFKVVAGQTVSLKLTGFTGSSTGNSEVKVTTSSSNISTTNATTLDLPQGSTVSSQATGTINYTVSEDGEVVLEIARSVARTARITEIVLTIAD